MYAARTNRPKQRQSQLKTFPAPTGGWISNRALSTPMTPGQAPGASVLDNFFPRSQGVVLRRGSQVHAALGDGGLPCLSLFSYLNGAVEHLFAATEGEIYDITTGTPTSVLGSLTGGKWIVTQFATTGGVYLIGVNGEDEGFLYDGAVFTDPSITFGSSGLTTADMAYVWIYKNRLWFIEKESLNAWYLPVDAIAGAADVLPLAGVLPRGGSLVFGQTWSLESGAEGGLSEQNIFVSTEGEVAIYQGADPNEAATWSKVGVYRIGRPLGNRAFLRGGGDLAIATSVGLVPLSKAIELDITSLNIATVSFNIADAWSSAVSLRGSLDWQCELWPDQKMAIVSPPDIIGGSNPVMFVSNTETGAWCRFTGWRALCLEVFRGQLYFGAPDGNVYQANISGMDDETPYTGAILPLFDDLGSPASSKIGKVGRAVIRAPARVDGILEMHGDFDEAMPAAPSAFPVTGASIWGGGVWGTSIWGDVESKVISDDWQSIGGMGYVCSLSYQITSGSAVPLDAEIIRMEMTYSTAEMVA